MAENIIQVKNLSKNFGQLKAVDNISFDVRKGSFFAFLGTNGAGKSTTIKMLTTLLKQDSGTFQINESNDETYIRSKIGVLFQENILDPFLTVKENLMFRGGLYLKNEKEVLQRYEELKEQFHFAEFENKLCKFLSGGQLRRVEIARALFSSPEILFLDEPTTGLDPESRKIVWKILQDLKKQNNLTIFLTTHYMEETENADYVVIINKGKIVASGSPSELKHAHAKDVFKVVANNKKEFETYLTEKQIEFQKIADRFVISPKDTQNALEILVENKSNIKQFEMVAGTMDDVFLKIVGDENHDWVCKFNKKTYQNIFKR